MPIFSRNRNADELLPEQRPGNTRRDHAATPEEISEALQAFIRANQAATPAESLPSLGFKTPSRPSISDADLPPAAALTEATLDQSLRRPGQSAVSQPSLRSEPAAAARVDTSPGDSANSEKDLVIGREITLKGEIGPCDRLLLRGKIEGAINACRKLEILASGLLRGSAKVKEAEIAGRFEGELTVEGTVTVRATGRIRGTIEYARLRIEEGGSIDGELRNIAASPQTTSEPDHVPGPHVEDVVAD